MPNFDKAGALVRNGRLYSFGVNLARLIKYKDTTVEHALDEHSDEIVKLKTSYSSTKNIVNDENNTADITTVTVTESGIYYAYMENYTSTTSDAKVFVNSNIEVACSRLSEQYDKLSVLLPLNKNDVVKFQHKANTRFFIRLAKID